MSPATPSPKGSELRFFPRLAQVALVLVAGSTLAYALLFVLSRYPFEYLEGVLLDAARRIASGAPLYCDIATELPCVLLPHPPVYVGVVAALGKVFGVSLGLGRLVSFAALLGTLALLYRIARQQVGARAAVLAPALYLVFGEVGYFSALMRPEPLALCLELAALLILLGKPSTLRSVAGALLLVIALYAKPNLLAGPMAITLLLARRDRRQVAVFIVTGVVASALVLFGGDRLSGGFFIKNHVVAHADRVYALSQFLRILWYGALPWLPLLAGAVALAAREVKRRAFDFPLVFFLVALVWCVLSGSIKGAAAYYYLELYAATGLLLATRIEALSAAADGATESFFSFRRLLRAAVWVQLALSLVVNPLIGTERYGSYLRLWQNAPALLAQLRDAPGMILVEDPILAAAAERPLLAEVFMNTELAVSGRWDERPFLDRLGSGDISRVVLRETPLDKATWLQRERFTPKMLATIAEHFTLSWSDGSWFVYTYGPASAK
jgi:hypothetical protein